MAARDKTFSADQSLAPPTSIYSINRTSASTCLPYSINAPKFVVIKSSDGHRIKFKMWKPHAADDLNAFQDLLERISSGQGTKSFGPERIQTHRHAMQAGIIEILGLIAQQNAVRRHGNIFERPMFGEPSDQPRQVAAHEWFTASQTNLVDTDLSKKLGERIDFLKAQQCLPRQPCILLLPACNIGNEDCTDR